MPRVACRVSLVALLTVFGMAALQSVTAAPFQPRENPVRAELISEHTSIQPGGSTRVGILFHIKEGWHIYAQDPGEAGLPTKAIWTLLLPSGAYIETPPQWPPAKKFVDAGNIHTFGYSGTLVLTSTLHATTEISAIEIPITAHAEWLACHEICIPGKADLKLTLPVSPATPLPSPEARLFQENK